MDLAYNGSDFRIGTRVIVQSRNIVCSEKVDGRWENFHPNMVGEVVAKLVLAPQAILWTGHYREGYWDAEISEYTGDCPVGTLLHPKTGEIIKSV